MGARQHADFGHDRADRLQIASVDAFAGVEDVPAHYLGFERLEHAADLLLVEAGFGAFREEMRHDLLLGGFHRLLTHRFLRDGVGSAQVLLDDAEHFLFQRVGVRQLEVARLLRRLFGELDDGVDDRLEMPMSEHHRAEHDFFTQLLGFRFHHEHGVGSAGHHEVELALHHFVELRIEHVFIADEADAGGADRSHEGRAGERERGRCRHHGHHIGIVLKIVRQRGDDHLGVAAIALGE